MAHPAMGFEEMTISELSNEIGVRLRAERIRMGLTQADMADKALLPVRTYRRLETAGVGSVRVLLCALKACNRLKALQISLPQRELPKVRNALSIVEQSRVRRSRSQSDSRG
ncbi:hypothetical protein E4695_05795 [Alcaligenaceae bacterium 429]|nr:hypothetical protein E4695_05795 [Alcaligenaceae bacterium 429]